MSGIGMRAGPSTHQANPVTRRARTIGTSSPSGPRDEYVPLLYSRAAIEQAAESRIRLLPVSAATEA